MIDDYFIWSHEHGAWWGPGRCGYTLSAYAAGRYGREEAIAISVGARGGWKDGDAPPEIPVRAAYALECERLTSELAARLRGAP